MKSRISIVDVFTITGRGTVFTGTVLEGLLNLGDTVRIGEKDYVCTGIESFVRDPGLEATVGRIIGVLLRGATKEELSRWKGTEAIGRETREASQD